MSGYRLVALECPSCGAPLAAEGEDVVYYCTACRNGFRFDDAAGALTPVEVSFVALSNVVADRYLPFWLLPARVAILERAAGGSPFRGLMSLFLGQGGGGAPRGGDGTFAVPAFRASLAAVTELAKRYTVELPKLGERLGERLTGGCYGATDAQKLAHYALIATEVEKPDLLRQLRYEIEFGTPRLLGVPFVERGDRLADALFGVTIEPAA